MKEITETERDQTKRIVYSVMYGVGMYGGYMLILSILILNCSIKLYPKLDGVLFLNWCFYFETVVIKDNSDKQFILICRKGKVGGILES